MPFNFSCGQKYKYVNKDISVLVKIIVQNLLGALVSWSFENFLVIKFLVVNKKNYSYQRFNYIAGESENVLFPTVYMQILVFFVLVFFFLFPLLFMLLLTNIMLFC